MNMNMYIIIILLCIVVALWLLRPINDNFVVGSTTSPAVTVKVYTTNGDPIEFPLGEYITLKQITDLGLTNGKTKKIVVPEGLVISVWVEENMNSYYFSRSFGPGEYDVNLTIKSMSVIAEDISNMVQIQEPDITITAEGLKYNVFFRYGAVIVIPAGITFTVYINNIPTIYNKAGEYTIDVYMSWVYFKTSAATPATDWKVTIKPNKIILTPNNLINFVQPIPENSKLSVPVNHTVAISDKTNINVIYKPQEAYTYTISTEIASIMAVLTSDAIILTDTDNNNQLYSYNNNILWKNNNIWNLNFTTQKLVVPDNIVVKIHNADNNNSDADFTSGTYEALNHVTKLIKIEKFNYETAIILTDENNNKKIVSYNKDELSQNIGIPIYKSIQKLVVPNEYAVLFNDKDWSIKKIYISGTYTDFDFQPGIIELYKTSPCGSAAPVAPVATAASCIISGGEKVSFEKLEGVISKYYDAL